MKIYLDKIRENGSADGAALLAFAVKKEFGLDMPEIKRDSFGKPSFPEGTGVFFSISHSGEHVMCAVSEKPLGADIQKDIPVSEKTVSRVCTERELRETDFISLWCLKESFIKLKGRLDRGYREIEFVRDGGLLCGPDGCVGALLPAPEGYKMAVCGENTGEISGADVCNLF